MGRARKKTGKRVAADKAKVIAVARDAELPRRIEGLFRAHGVRVSCESTIDRALERFESEFFEVLVVTTSAIRADDSDEIELLDVIAAESPATEVLLLAEARDIRIAVSAMKAGAYQYAKVPLADNELRLLIKAAMEKARQHAGALGPGGTEQEGQVQEMVGNSQPMQDALDRLRRGGFAAILVDQHHVEVDVLEFVLNVRDIDKHVPVFVVGRSQDDNAEKTATVLHATSFLDKSEVREKLAEELEKVLSNEQRAGPEQD